LLLYYITDRSQFPGDEASRRRRLLENIAQAARSGVDYVQLREKDLSTHDLETLAREVVAIFHKLRTENQKLKTGFLINSRTDVALASGADGIHLRSDDITPAEVRRIWAQSGAVTRGTVGVSCHTPGEVADAAAQGADYVVFGPVFEKEFAAPAGLGALGEACKQKIPVFALGGVTMANAESCIQAGAAGVAGIRLFQKNEMQKNDPREVVAALRRPAAQ
jgi:thiamine-phosphate pyrophosphorylase